jgi:2-haloacid dehalogenase/putative hydrolase of the HAD superfamily
MSWPKAILLDFYGTVVVEDTAVLGGVCEDIARVGGSGVGAGEVAEFWWGLFPGLIERSNGETFLSQVEIEILSLEQVLEHFRVELDARKLLCPVFEYWKNPALWPEAREVLAECELPICLVSNIDNFELSAALANLDLHFDMVVTSEECRAYKPHPAPFMRALELLGLEPHEVLHVGDSLGSDVRGAQALGIPVMWINRNGRDLPDGYLPEYVSPDLRGLLGNLVGLSDGSVGSD